MNDLDTVRELLEAAINTRDGLLRDYVKYRDDGMNKSRRLSIYSLNAEIRTLKATIAEG